MPSLCNVNGKILPEAEATVPVLDRGFLFGDSVYEVTKIVDDVPFAWPEHLDRLHRSAEGLQLEFDLSDGELTRRMMETHRAAEVGDSYCRVIVTRGPGSAPNIDTKYALGQPTTVIMVRPIPEGMSAPAHVAIVPRLRTDKRSLDPAIKSGNYLNNVMGLKEARDAGATDCLFLNHDGVITEASTSNIWVMKDGVIRTPALAAGLLAGITRSLLMAMCEQEGIPCEEGQLTEEDVLHADSLFLTSSMRDIAPVVRLNGKDVAGGQVPGTVQELSDRFKAFCRQRIESVYRPALEKLLA